MNIGRFHIIIFLAAAFVLQGCASVPRFTSRNERYKSESKETPPQPKEQENLDRYLNAPALETVEGAASFYADKYNGRITYNGEVYDMNGVSAAHPTYRMGTVVRVTNLSNNKSLLMRINDRMPFRPDRVIDLSLGSAKLLDIVRGGLAKVRIEVLEWGTGKN